MNQRGGLLALMLGGLILGALMFFFLHAIGDPTGIPLFLGIVIPTFGIGLIIAFIGLIAGGEPILICLGAAICLHWAWISGVLPH